MISKAILKQYNFKSMDEYFNLIFLNEVNGNRGDVHKGINKLSKQQKKDFLEYLNHNEHGTDAEIIKNILITSL